jgi:hypothetical protein
MMEIRTPAVGGNKGEEVGDGGRFGELHRHALRVPFDAKVNFPGHVAYSKSGRGK